jgi:pyruvate-formate lyase-activating enzyme
VLNADQNITLKMSPGVDVEVVTFLKPGFTFEEAWERAVQQDLSIEPSTTFRVLAFDDLVTSKLRAARPKDLLDVHELQRRRAKG